MIAKLNFMLTPLKLEFVNNLFSSIHIALKIKVTKHTLQVRLTNDKAVIMFIRQFHFLLNVLKTKFLQKKCLAKHCNCFMQALPGKVCNSTEFIVP